MIHAIDYAPITGLTLSGDTDLAVGTWNEGVDLNAIAEIPAGATGVVIHFMMDNSTGQEAAIRATGTTSTVYELGGNILRSIQHFVPFKNSQTVDLFLSSSGARFFIVGYTLGNVVYFDRDAGLPVGTGPGGGSSSAVNDFTAPEDVPLNALGTLGGPARLKDATFDPEKGLQSYANVDGSMRLAPVKERIWRGFNSSSEIPVEAYVTGGIQYAFLPVALPDISEANTWVTANQSNPAASGALVAFRINTTNQRMRVRAKGSTFDQSEPYSHVSNYFVFLTKLGESGEFEINLHDTAINEPAEIDVLAWTYDDASSGPVAGIPATTINNADGTPATGTAITRTITRVSDSMQLFAGSQTSDATTGELPEIDLSETDAAVDDVVDDRIVIDGATAPALKSQTFRITVEDLAGE